MNFDNARDANQYLAGTVCYWGESPFFVDHVDETFQAHGYLLPLTNNSAVQLVDCNDRRFNCREYKLGYMNSAEGSAYYVSRLPARHVQQGIAGTNTLFLRAGDAIPARRDRFGGRGYGMQEAIRDQGFVDMLQGRYPPAEEVARRLVEGGARSVAVSRFLAIKRHPQFKNLNFLEYKGREVSYSETLAFDLPEEFVYLRELCQPAGVLKQ